MMIRKFLVSMIALLSAIIYLFGQELPQLPNDPETRVGVLENGMTYYIRYNNNPAERAEFYLATNVGALQETPEQDGLAHFLEHMCFNGTKNFPEKGILDWLQSIGASFGGNVNASTGVEQTVYMLNNIPLIRPTVVDTCLLIMHDYSHFVTCDPEEIDKERGVIIEEKRSRNNASWRMFEASQPYLYGDSKYNGCTIIGSEENLRNFKPESLVEFYQTWYRPDMQALIVVGDIDVDEVESKIISIFSDIPAAENPRQKDIIKIPDNSEPIIGILTDPENSSINFSVYWKGEPTPEIFNSTSVGLMQDILESIVSVVMNERLSDISARPDAPYINARMGMGGLTETCDVVLGSVVCKDDMILDGFRTLLVEIERMKRYGFTDNEIERAKSEVLSRYENAMNRADTRKNSEFVWPLIMNFFDNEAFMDPATAYEYASELMAQLPSVLINQVVAQLIPDENMVVIYTAPAREGLVHPSEEEVLAVIKAVETAEIERPEGENVPDAFLDPSSLEGGKVVKSSEGLYGSTVVELSNGLKVVMLPTEYEKDRISFTLYKKGGRSLISDEELYSMESSILSLFNRNSGLSEFSGTTVSKMLSGKQVSVSTFIEEYRHGVRGNSTGKDIETALQMAYLYFADPRFDENEYNQGISQIKNLLPNLTSTPNWKLNEALIEVAYDSPRRFLLSEEVLEKADLNTLEKNYRKLFSDVAGATVVVVGDFQVDSLVPMVEKYLGSINSGTETTDWSYRNDGILSGKLYKDFNATMETPMVTVFQIYNIETPYSIENELRVSALKYILDMIYVETLREEEGGTYGAGVMGEVDNVPNESVSLQVYFNTNPDDADKLRALAVKGLEDIAKAGPTADHFDKTINNLKKNVPENKLRNSYWLNALIRHEAYGTADYIAEYEAALEALTPEKIQQLASELIESGNFIEVVMRPEVQ